MARSTLPLALPFTMPLPRRLMMLIGITVTVFLILHTFAPAVLPPALVPWIPHHEPDSSYWSTNNWTPPVLSDTRPDKIKEWDENGRCLFVSPFDALSPKERKLAATLSLEEVVPGIFGVRGAGKTESDANGTVSKLETPNPILALLKEGEEKWQKLVNRQSKTLEQAVKVYEERWGRPPPKGFDDWWRFAEQHEVMLPDEYDAIMESLMPFYGLPIGTLKEREEDAEKVVETFTLIIGPNDKGEQSVELQWNDDYARDTWWASRGRAESQIELMEPFLHMLPKMRTTFSIHDQPTILLDYQRNQELLKAAEAHQVSTHPNEEDRHEQVYERACSPTSRLKMGDKDQLQGDTFIFKHLAAMNPCDHPSLLDTHGMFLEKHNEGTHPQPHTKLLPLFVPSKTILNGDIPVTPIGKDGRRDDVGPDPKWTSKNGKVYWRGLATGLNKNKKEGSRWRESHRERLHFLANEKDKDKTAEILEPIESSGMARYKNYTLRSLGQYYMNAKLADQPWQCDGNDGTCDEMKAEIDFAPKDPSEKSNEYKYILDVDGNAWSSRFPRLMASLNVVIKSTVFPEWNSHFLPEWYAYVPTKVDYSDLYSIMSFFRGKPNGKGSHDEVARRIALNGQCWVERTWRRQDLQAYMFRLFLEYGRLIHPDRDSGVMDFVLQDYHKDNKEPEHEHKEGEKKEGENAADELNKEEAIPGIES
ncbi:Beta-1,2-xylosyltransferase 1 [Vanrija pseudolonga]|uniref:Beta-1,2-xylosyltransferase 1 n=1 Tax=Vanrija pseudolonga TaxID=143232 RepID=A0AAF1BK58_9TREE|nr:Beta-1,2-xylosyltransferase 1 [Vanrija pseudolonga]